ncbi:MAG: hypothetical protein QG599_892 [Pseudomonadota bacterium]|nr:hypothetical protein [Pseudomonadota bacterium]
MRQTSWVGKSCKFKALLLPQLTSINKQLQRLRDFDRRPTHDIMDSPFDNFTAFSAWDVGYLRLHSTKVANARCLIQPSIGPFLGSLFPRH